MKVLDLETCLDAQAGQFVSIKAPIFQIFDIQWNIDSHGAKNCSFSEQKMYVNLFKPAIRAKDLRKSLLPYL